MLIPPLQIDDTFCDEVRLSSTRSSLSIISGGAKPTAFEPHPSDLSRDFRLTDVNEHLFDRTPSASDNDTDRENQTTPTPTDVPPPITEDRSLNHIEHNGNGHSNIPHKEEEEELDPSNPFYAPKHPPPPRRAGNMESRATRHTGANLAKKSTDPVPSSSPPHLEREDFADAVKEPVDAVVIVREMDCELSLEYSDSVGSMLECLQYTKASPHKSH